MGRLYGITIDASDPFFGILTDDTAILAQACVLRLQTAHASLWTDPEYGLPLTELVGEGLTADALARIPGRVQAELEKDERIASVDVEATISGTAGALVVRLAIRVTPLDAFPPFPLTLEVSALSVEILSKGSV